MTTATLPRPAERVAIVSLLLVFLCGAALGAVAMSYWTRHRPLVHAARTGGAGMNMTVDEWKQQLNLSDEQTRQMTSLLDDFSHYYDDLLSFGSTKILNILNDDQKARYREMIRKHKMLQDHAK
jgi:predicted PurR-regulated permease PerM